MDHRACDAIYAQSWAHTLKDVEHVNTADKEPVSPDVKNTSGLYTEHVNLYALEALEKFPDGSYVTGLLETYRYDRGMQAANHTAGFGISQRYFPSSAKAKWDGFQPGIRRSIEF